MDFDQFRSVFERNNLLPMPDPGTYAEALLAVLRLGYVVEPFGDASDPGDDSIGGAVEQLRELGWPLQCIPLTDEKGSQHAVGYTLKAPFVPGWTWAAPIPLIRMAIYA